MHTPVTQHQFDSLRKADPKRFKGSDPKYYTQLIITYTDANGKTAVKRVFRDPSELPPPPPPFQNPNAPVTAPGSASQVQKTSGEPIQKDKVYSAAEVSTQPEFPGGLGEFYKALIKEFKVPKSKEKFVAKIYISFTIETDGSMIDFKILRDPGNGLGDEALRALKTMDTKWSPGKVQGKAVRASYNLPITVNVKKTI